TGWLANLSFLVERASAEDFIARPGLTELPVSYRSVESTLACGTTDMKVIRNSVTRIGESPAE
ncbi:hypothetical protein AB0H18_28795, partial [Streptomyces sp. NPDC020766]|uniref:hypothetical protein n=1 Tax=Streptomyces sp. NPDC020766 TaxID=3155011 RepID=UPI0033F7AD42